MKRYHSISYLTSKEQNELQHITKKILENLRPLAVYYYGGRVNQQINRSCLTPKRRTEFFRSSFDLLIVTDDQDPLDDQSATLIAERLAGQYGHVHIALHRSAYVEHELKAGNFFITCIFRSAVKLYEKGHAMRFDLVPARQKNNLDLRPEMFQVYQSYLSESKAHLDAAQKQFNSATAISMLDQLQHSVICSLKAIITAGTEYDFRGQQIERMIRFTENFTTMAAELFPANTPEEQRIHYLLLTPPMALEKENKEIKEPDIHHFQSRVTLLYQKAQDFVTSDTTLLKYNPSAKTVKAMSEVAKKTTAGEETSRSGDPDKA